MPVGVILAFLAYASFSIADALIKATGPTMSVFEIAFFTTSLSIIPAILTKRGERWRDLYKLRHPWLVHLRCATAISGTACVMFAFTHIPFADVYAIGFLTPIIVTLLGVLVLREHVALHRWLLLIISFLGVVVLSGLVNVLIDGTRARIAGRFAEYRARRPEAPTDIAEVQGPEI